METNIRYPVDSPLLVDGVCVLTPVIQCAKHVVQSAVVGAQATFRERTRSVNRGTRRLIAAAHQRGKEAADRVQATYQQLVGFTALALPKRTTMRTW